jgi:hypothetical protein
VSLGAIVYLLCFFSSGLCAYLLVTAFRRGGQRLLLWSAVCFCLLTLNNLLVLVDLILLPDIDLMPLRSLTSLIAVAILIYGFIWETD